jgi:hypothetical protein
MSDTRTDREELARLILDSMENGTDTWQECATEAADAILAARFARRLPRPSTIAVPHTPEEIWAAADVWCDLDFWDKHDLEYTEYGIEHIPSGATISPDHAHLPVELRPDIGEDRVDVEG